MDRASATAGTATSGLFVALDTSDAAHAAAMARRLADAVDGVKIGLELFTACGPAGIRAVATAALFLDLKLHDIPNTVAGAVRAAAAMRPALLTLHAAGGRAMLSAAVAAAAEAAGAAGTERPRLVAVTVLTSLDDDDLAAVGQQGPMLDQVRRLADLAQRCGVDGAVCSPREVECLRRQCGPEFILVTPGIRPSWAEAGDQRRATAPAQAVGLGADILVVGRPITAAADPADAARRIRAEMRQAHRGAP